MASNRTTDVSNPYEKIRANNTIARMQFPSDMGRYYIAFEFAEYSINYNKSAAELGSLPSDALNAIGEKLGLDFGFGDFRNIASNYGIGDVNAAIALPMPPNLVDNQQLDYSQQNMTELAAAGISNIASAAASKDTKLGRFAGLVNSSEKVISSLNSFQSPLSGYSVNPFLALMFNGPKFKSHQFGWRFSPKTRDETHTLMKIINTFKANSLPALSGGAIFTYPNVVLISLYPENARNKMYKFKPALITETSVHYAPSGTPSFFAETNAPVEIELKIQLMEMSIWTKEDVIDYNVETGGPI